MADSIIKVDYTLYTSTYSIKKVLPKVLAKLDIMSFDVETRSIYDKGVRDEAAAYLKDVGTGDSLYKQARVVSASNGLSYPSITRTTHFIFGESKSKSHVVVCNSDDIEMFLWNLLAEYRGLCVVHNSLFDLKIMYERIKKLPKNYVDTALMAKCLVNHVNIWKAKTGLKDLMGSYYSPRWSLLVDDYDIVNLKDKNFLSYCSIDGAATFYLYELILEEYANT